MDKNLASFFLIGPADGKIWRAPDGTRYHLRGGWYALYPDDPQPYRLPLYQEAAKAFERLDRKHPQGKEVKWEEQPYPVKAVFIRKTIIKYCSLVHRTRRETLSVAEKNEEKETPRLQLITGGNDGDNVEPINWLKDLPVGTYFVCRERNTDLRNPMLQEFKIEWHSKRASALHQSTGRNGEQMEVTVDNMRFSRHMELIEIL